MPSDYKNPEWTKFEHAVRWDFFLMFTHRNDTLQITFLVVLIYKYLNEMMIHHMSPQNPLTLELPLIPYCIRCLEFHYVSFQPNQ